MGLVLGASGCQVEAGEQIVQNSGWKYILPSHLLLVLFLSSWGEREQTADRQIHSTRRLYWKHFSLAAMERPWSSHTNSLVHTHIHIDSLGTDLAGLSLGQSIRRPGPPFWSLVSWARVIHISLLKTQGSFWCCCLCSKGREERQGHGLESQGFGERVEAGLRRVRLALAEDFFSLRMMRSTQGWSGGAQSW